MHKAASSNAWSTMPLEDIPSSLIFNSSLLDLEANPSVLDIGCGSGGLIREIANKGGGTSIGLDINREAIRAGSSDAPSNCTLLVGDANEIPVGQSTIDVVVATAFFTTLDHQTVQLRVLQEIRRVLRVSGQLWILDFARSPEVPLYRDRYNEAKAKGYPDGTFPVVENGGIKYLAHHYTEDEFRGILKSAGLTVDQIQRVPVRSRRNHAITGLLVHAVPAHQGGSE